MRGEIQDPHGEEARSAVSNHEAGAYPSRRQLCCLAACDVPVHAGNQCRCGRLCTTGPGTWSCSRPTTVPPSILAGRSWIGSRERELLSSFLIAAFSARLLVP